MFTSASDGNDNVNIPAVQEVTVEVEGKHLTLEVQQANEQKEASWNFKGDVPNEAQDPQYVARVSKELQNTYKRALQKQQELKIMEADIKNQPTGNKNLEQEIANLKAMIEGIKIGSGKNDTGVIQKQDSQAESFNYEQELLQAAGVATWDEFDDLSQAQVAKAQAKAQNKQLNHLNQMLENQQKSQQEMSILADISNKGYSTAEFKAWMATLNLGNTTATKPLVDLFLNIKNQNKNQDKPDEIDRANQISQIRNVIPSQNHDGSIPDFRFEQPEQKARKEHVANLKELIEKNSNISVMQKLSKR